MMSVRCFERSVWLSCSGAECERPARQPASPEVIREMEHKGDFSLVEHVVWLASEQDWFGRMWRRLTSHFLA